MNKCEPCSDLGSIKNGDRHGKRRIMKSVRRVFDVHGVRETDYGERGNDYTCTSLPQSVALICGKFREP